MLTASRSQVVVQDTVLTVLTDTWSKSVARRILRRYPGRKVRVGYLRREGPDTWVDGSRYPEAELLDPDVSTVWMPDGRKFRYAAAAHEWELTLRFHRTVLKRSLMARAIGRVYSSRIAEVLYLRKFWAAVDSWVFLCLFAQHLADKEPDRVETTAVLVPANPFGAWLTDYLRSIYPNVVSWQPSYWRMLKMQGGEGLRLLLGRLARVLLNALKPSSGESLASSGGSVAPPSAAGDKNPDARHAIAVEAMWGLEPEKGRSDLFWLPGSDLDGMAQVMVYFDRPHIPASEETLAAVRDRGWHPVVLGTSGNAEVKPHESSPEWWRRLLMLSLAPLWLLAGPQRRCFHHWLWTHAAESLWTAASWQTLFEEHNIRLHSNHTDVQSSRHVELSVALERAGALNMRSDTTSRYSPALKLGSRITPFDAFFVWGPLMGGVLRELDVAGITTLVTAGYPFGHLFESARAEAARTRGQLRAAGASSIISFFDTGFLKRSETSLVDLEALYRTLLTEVIESPNLGLILKPKKRLELTALATPELGRLLDRAIATGRCISLTKDSASVPSRYPYEAAIAADLAVGYPINTAVIEGVLAGVPGVHIDLTREPGHPFYDEGYEQIVFDDLDRAMEAIRRWLRNPADAPGLGDHSNVIDSIDPFRDGKAAERVGRYMSWSMESFERGLSRDDVVRRSSRLYAELYGAEHVRLAPRLGLL